MKPVIPFLVLSFLLLSFHFSEANNVRFNGTVKVTGVVAGVATLEIDLNWENSWRDHFNWDAVWLFLKSKPNGGNWSHVILSDVEPAATNGFAVMKGKSDGQLVGVYVYRGSDGTGNASTKVTLKYACGSYTKADFDEKRVFLLAVGIEMVYVPFGSYYLGDGSSNQTFSDAVGKPVVIESENAVTLSQRSSNGTISTAVSNLPIAYPKGYAGFYVMKYEVSQEQYVTFLNTLTLAEQETLLDATFLVSLSSGNYLFGSKTAASDRNGIILSGKTDGNAYLFGHNLNGNTVFGEEDDGQTIACNYMSIDDALSYASWSGLRPMSEMEYEKACRAPFPKVPLAGEYAWNQATGVVKATSVNEKGREEELANAGANVNGGSALNVADRGPLRCGVFATSTSNQIASGGTFWGVMEMSGNLRELVATIVKTNFSRLINGMGVVDISRWAIRNVLSYGVRGGGYKSVDSYLRTSDRSEVAGCFATVRTRDATVGFRAVRTVDEGVVTIDPGSISLTAICMGTPSTIIETAPAIVTPANLPLTYSWYVKKSGFGQVFTLIPGESGATLTYNVTETVALQFKRKVTTPVGEAEAMTVEVTPVTGTLSLSATTISLDGCGNPTPAVITATGNGMGDSFSWTYNGNTLAIGKTFTPSRSGFGILTGEFNGVVECLLPRSGCVFTQKLAVKIPYVSTVPTPTQITLSNCGKVLFTDDRGGGDVNSYCTVLLGGKCWMGQNVNAGVRVEGSDYTTHNVSGIQKICYNNIPVNCGQYGGLYNWDEIMQGAASSALNPSGVRGICPVGWHLPSDAEFQLIVNDPLAVASFKEQLGGQRASSNGTFSTGSGCWFGATEYNTTQAWRYSVNEASTTIGRTAFGGQKTGGYAVRCILN